MQAISRTPPPPPHSGAATLDDESREWLDGLRATGARHERTVARLRDLLLGAARFEVRRRAAASAPALRGPELEDIALQAAHDASLGVLAKLDDFRGASRFTTWAYKFAILEAGVAVRRLAWRDCEVVLHPDAWAGLPEPSTAADEAAEHSELLQRVTAAINSELTPHQREVLIALAVDGIPLDVLADRLGTTRGALYKSLHDARRKLRATLAADGLIEETS